MLKHKIGHFLVTLILIFSFVLSVNFSLAVYSEEETGTTGSVESIILSGVGNVIEWGVNGNSPKGFKVVWSKNSSPTYPTRSGDKYHYYSDPGEDSDELTAFSGDGAYYVRVCEYLGGECGIYSNEIKVNLIDNEKEVCTMEYSSVCGKDGKTYSNKCMLDAAGVAKRSYGKCIKDDRIIEIEDKASKLANNQLDEILSELQSLRDLVKEQQIQILHLHKLLSGVASITTAMQDSINQFIAYGVDENTKKLGEGERAAVMYSYKEAFGKLPEGEADLADAIKIANGRWPSKKSESAEYKAKEKFKVIYKRKAEDKTSDNAAVVIMTYGLRQRAENRKLESEQNGLKIYKDIFGALPETTEDWNTLQAITYSGATR